MASLVFVGIALGAPASHLQSESDVGSALGLIGGCTAHTLRASYTEIHDGENNDVFSCNRSTPCQLCGQCGPVASFPSGMELPRHNVRQYLGNAAWDGIARDGFGRLVGAMLGDPFAFVMAPETDALRRLLLNPTMTSEELQFAMGSAWTIDGRYPGAGTDVRIYTSFMRAIAGGQSESSSKSTSSGLTSAFVLNSRAWGRLGPPAVKRLIEQALRGEVQLSNEAAICAAVHMTDSMFVQRGQQAIMNDLPSDPLDMVNIEPVHPTIFEELYASTPSAAIDTHNEYGNIRDDPHNVIFTTPYQYNAQGWYGGDLSVSFSSVQEGSGIDTHWAVNRGCPITSPANAFCDQRRAWLNLVTNASHTNGSAYKPACDTMHECSNFSTWGIGGGDLPTADVGEIRTPNYKAPREVLGFTMFEWDEQNIQLPCGIYAHNRTLCTTYAPSPHGIRRIMDFTQLIRPSQWAVERYISHEATESDNITNMAYILAPGMASAGVFAGVGVYGYTPDEASGTFVAAPQPPLSWGAETWVQEENYISKDLPTPTTRKVPVWGMLYVCETSNLPQRAYMEPDNATTPLEPARCAAAAVLRRHRNDTLYEPMYSALYREALPTRMESVLTNLRVWEPSATLDLGAGDGAEGGTHPTGGRMRSVCVLSFAAAIHLDRLC